MEFTGLASSHQGFWALAGILLWKYLSQFLSNSSDMTNNSSDSFFGFKKVASAYLNIYLLVASKSSFTRAFNSWFCALESPEKSFPNLPGYLKDFFVIWLRISTFPSLFFIISLIRMWTLFFAVDTASFKSVLIMTICLNYIVL